MSSSAIRSSSKTPLLVIAGSHGSLHWVLGTFYLLLPFIQQSLGLTYTQTGALASVVHLASFAANVPSGVLVDLSGRRLLCQILSLVIAALAIGCGSLVHDYWTVLVLAALIASMNTLWHPAAISYLSSQYSEQRGLALSFHTVGASIGDALAPLAIGTLIAIVGWKSAALAGAGPPLIAALVLGYFFGRRANTGDADGHMRTTTGGLRGYWAGLRQVVGETRLWFICALAGLRGTAQAGLRAFLPLYVVNELGANAVWIGFVMLAFQGTGAFTTPVAGSLSDRYGRRPILLVGLLIAGIATLFLPMMTHPWSYTLLVALIGGSLFSLRPVIQGWALDITPRALGGSTISILFGAQSGFAMAIPLLGGIIADRYGLSAAFFAFGVAALLAAAVVVNMRDESTPR
ncbi:MAG: MFS transporter [Pseudomonadota bacterium]